MRPDPATGSPRLWTRDDGTVAASFEIQAETVRFMSSRDRDDNGSNSSGFRSGSPEAVREEDDIPF